MSKIEWCDDTWNPIVGCEIASPGCTNCYAMNMAARLQAMGKDAYQGLTHEVNGNPVWTGKVAQQPSQLEKPITLTKPKVFFVGSMSDLFAETVPTFWLDQVFDVMDRCPQHVFLLLTKRPDRMRIYFQRRYKGQHAPGHIWAGTSVEDQVRADLRLPDLIGVAAQNCFVSAEPLLAPVDLSPWMGDLAWVVGGGESGMTARKCHPDWARALRDQCVAAAVPFMWKQWGRWKPELVDGEIRFNDQKPKGAGKALEGKFHSARPTVFNTRPDQEAAE